jgi:OOP family OmpA-OmpF porin
MPLGATNGTADNRCPLDKRDQMTTLDNTIEDVAGRFGLGPKTGPLMNEITQLITGSPGGIGGFIDKFRSAGLGSEAASWLGRTDGAALTAPQVEKALGSTALGGIASRLGLKGGVVATAIGYLLPKLIGQLTPGGVIPSGIPASFSGFVQEAPVQPTKRRVEQVAPLSMSVIPDAKHLGRWIMPVLGGLGVLGLGWYLLSGTTPTPVVTTSTPAPVVQVRPVPLVPARLELSDDGVVITYSGTVHDESTRLSIIDSLKGVFGADRVRGDITINGNAGPMPWLVDLRTALGQLKTPGVQAVFDGNSLKVGGLIGDSDRDGIINSLRSVIGNGLVFGALTDKMGNLIPDPTSRTTAALSALPTGFRTTDLLGILNQSIINFPTNSAEIPAISKTLLQQAAVAFKQLPSGTIIEIGGYTDNTGDPAANVQLSQQRADAVRAALVQSGVDSSMLAAKGYGSANPVAGNDSLEGRLQNRRIEYRVVKV